MSRLLSSLLVAATLLATPFAAGAAQADPRTVLSQQANADLLLVRDDHRGRDRWDRDDRRHGRDEWRGGRDGCGPRQALRKASRMGLRGADIERVGRRGVTVSGWRRGEPTFVRFAQAPGCPVIGYR